MIYNTIIQNLIIGIRSILILLLIFSSTTVFSQKKRVLRSHENMKRLEALDSSVAAERATIEDFISKNQNSGPLTSSTIPVVFHLIDHVEQQKIGDRQVYAQLDALNRDFGNPPLTLRHASIAKEGFGERREQMEIQFCIPIVSNRSAIIRRTTERQEWGMDDDMKSAMQGGLSPLDTRTYLNIWVVNLADSVSGFAQLPGGPIGTDGIVIDKDLFGVYDANSIYKENKTLTHLVGNYLGLHSLWGEDRCADDFVTDTPIHNSRNYDCPVYKHFSTCTGEIEMSMNFMDNSMDECLQFFTRGQKARLYAFLSEGGARASLLNTQTACSSSIVTKDSITVAKKAIKTSTVKVSIGYISLFPNPTKGLINMSFRLEDKGETSLQIIDANGKELFIQDQVAPNSDLSIDALDWPTGVYFVRVKTKEELIYSEQIVIAR